jgi:hypothetical protein
MSRGKRASSGRPQHPKGLPATIPNRHVEHAVIRRGSVVELPAADTLQGIVDAATEIDAATEALGESVAVARADGHTWGSIGQALGTTAQSAHKRFSRKVVEA